MTYNSTVLRACTVRLLACGCGGGTVWRARATVARGGPGATSSPPRTTRRLHATLQAQRRPGERAAERAEAGWRGGTRHALCKYRFSRNGTGNVKRQTSNDERDSIVVCPRAARATGTPRRATRRVPTYGAGPRLRVRAHLVLTRFHYHWQIRQRKGALTPNTRQRGGRRESPSPSRPRELHRPSQSLQQPICYKGA